MFGRGGAGHFIRPVTPSQKTAAEQNRCEWQDRQRKEMDFHNFDPIFIRFGEATLLAGGCGTVIGGGCGRAIRCCGLAIVRGSGA